MNLFGGIQSALNPQGSDAAAIAELSWVLFVGGTVVFVVTMALTALAVWRRPAWLAHHRSIIVGGIVVPLAVVFALLIYSLRIAAGSLHHEDRRRPAAVQIDITGHQWWWQVRYLTADGNVDFETANELRLPVGLRADITVRSADVLHSFWVPNLAGKIDLVPGRTNRLRLAPQRAGVFRGQCAEYCGGPHALMAMMVVATPGDEFEQWRRQQRRPAQAGNALFESRCAVCHTVRGTAASGTLGPDLTHVGSRLSIGAGILPNNEGTLASWIASNQHIKPGNLMPSFPMFDGDELRTLAEYLTTLK